MEAVTLLIAVLGMALIFGLRPFWGVIVFITALVWYPSYLTVKLGTLDFSVSRVLSIVILLKIFLCPQLLKNFKFIVLDKFILGFAGLTLVAGFCTTEATKILEYWGGSVADTVLVYFAVRIILTSKEDYLKFLKLVILVSIPFSLIAIYQSITGSNPFGFLQVYNAFKVGAAGYTPLSRSGFYRANLTFGVSIMLGLYFTIVFGCGMGISKYTRKNKMFFYTLMGVLAMAIAASMSSGPLLAFILLVMVLILYKYRQYWKLFVTTLLFGILLVEIASNTAWYEALSRLTFSEETARYRVLLIRKVFGGGMAGHWLTGYGLVDPGWGEYLSGQSQTDACNQYIEILIMYGLLGLVPFLGILVYAFVRLRESFVKTVSDAERWLVWTVMSTLIALLITFVSVSLFAQTRTVFFMMLAFCANMPIFIGGNVYSAHHISRSKEMAVSIVPK